MEQENKVYYFYVGYEIVSDLARARYRQLLDQPTGYDNAESARLTSSV